MNLIYPRVYNDYLITQDGVIFNKRTRRIVPGGKYVTLRGDGAIRVSRARALFTSKYFNLPSTYRVVWSERGLRVVPPKGKYFSMEALQLVTRVCAFLGDINYPPELLTALRRPT
jgi:hypothetical protein